MVLLWPEICNFFYLTGIFLTICGTFLTRRGTFLTRVMNYTHMMSMKIVQFSRASISLVHLCPVSFHPLDLGRLISDTPIPLAMITNQSKENIIQGWLLYVIGSFPQVGFFFPNQPINLVWLSFDLFSFSWSLTIYLLLCGIILLCVQLSEKIKKFLLYIIIHIFSSHFAINVFFPQLENVNKLWNNNRTVDMNEQNQNKITTKYKK